MEMHFNLPNAFFQLSIHILPVSQINALQSIRSIQLSSTCNRIVILSPTVSMPCNQSQSLGLRSIFAAPVSAAALSSETVHASEVVLSLSLRTEQASANRQQP